MTTKGNFDPYLQPRNQPTSNRDTLFLLEVGEYVQNVENLFLRQKVDEPTSYTKLHIFILIVPFHLKSQT